jgi:hypothetical protein
LYSNLFRSTICQKRSPRALTRGVLPLALRAATRSKFAPGEFVNHSATSPLVKIPSPTRARGLHITDGD